MPGPFPHVEPRTSGHLDVGDGHRIWWEESGAPEGIPAVTLHGGPGSGLSPGRRTWFDPDRYRLIQFDQRGAGRSTPSAVDPSTSLEANTTHHLIADLERLREHLRVDRWLVWGASWGVTLALAYAQRHPERTRALVLLSVTNARRTDFRWLYHEAGRFFPAQWARFRAGAGFETGDPSDPDLDLVSAYNDLLNEHPDRAVRERAARDWCAWEDAVVSLEEGWEPNPRYEDPAFRMQFARLCAHYFSHQAWLEEGELLAGMGKLSGIPGVLIQGRFDIGGPPDNAWAFARAWPDAELHLVRTGHTGNDEVNRLQLEALNRLAR